MVFVRFTGLQGMGLHVTQCNEGLLWDMYTYNLKKTEQLSHTFLMVIGNRRFFRIQDSSKAQSHGN